MSSLYDLYLHEGLTDQAIDLAFLGINVSPEQDDYVLPFMKGTKFSFTPLRGNGRWAGEVYHVRGEPTNFLIDQEGKIVYSNFMIDGNNEQMLEMMINSMLAKKGKESYRWIETSLKSKEVLQTAREIIIIQDREGDIYEQFAIVPDPKAHLLIRAKTNRVLQGEQKLFDYLASQPLQGSYQVKVEGDKRRNTSAENFNSKNEANERSKKQEVTVFL